MIEGIIFAVVGLFLGAGGTVVYERQQTKNGKVKADKEIAQAKIKA